MALRRGEVPSPDGLGCLTPCVYIRDDSGLSGGRFSKIDVSVVLQHKLPQIRKYNLTEPRCDTIIISG